MKKALVTFISAAIIAYTFGAFVEMAFNPVVWNEDVRGFSAILWFVMLLIRYISSVE